MGLLSRFRRQGDPSPDPAAPPADAVQQARARARQRLIGAVVLLGLGVIGFPLLFETQPRPIPVDVVMELPRRENAPPLPLPEPRAPSAAGAEPAPVRTTPPDIVEKAADAGREVAPPAAAAPATPREPAAKPPAEKPVEKTEQRVIVQVGAFADAGTAREARAKVEKLGLKTYTQAVETEGGTRIRVRVGPFGSREEADKAASRLKAAGLPAAILTL